MGKGLTVQRYEVYVKISEASHLTKRFMELTDAMEYYYHTCDKYMQSIVSVHVFDFEKKEKVKIND